MGKKSLEGKQSQSHTATATAAYNVRGAGKHRTNNIHYLHETESLLNQGYMKEALLGRKNPC